MELVPGFLVKPGAVFEAYLSNCASVNLARDDQEMSLSLAAYPNPFATNTLIEYGLPLASTVSISITDVRGIVLSGLLTDQPQSEGLHKVTFESESLPEGVYICVVSTPYERKSLRIVKHR